jgi:hypothetical protein
VQFRSNCFVATEIARWPPGRKQHCAWAGDLDSGGDVIKGCEYCFESSGLSIEISFEYQRCRAEALRFSPARANSNTF